MAILNVCVGICKMHEEFLICKGCYRSRLEIAKWVKSTDEQKLVIIKSAEIKKNIYGDLSDDS